VQAHVLQRQRRALKPEAREGRSQRLNLLDKQNSALVAWFVTCVHKHSALRAAGFSLALVEILRSLVANGAVNIPVTFLQHLDITSFSEVSSEIPIVRTLIGIPGICV
jgi:hypothetical protein